MLNTKEAALKALALDNSLAEAYISMGYILRTYDWNWSAAEEAYKKGIALNSNYATGHDYYALLLTSEGTLVYINVEPLFKPLHDDTRFKNLVISMGLRPN